MGARIMIKVCVLFDSKNTSGVDYHRLEIPFSNLGTDHKDLQITVQNGFTYEHPPTIYDIIVLNRLSKQPENYLKRAKDAGVKIILDLDDWIELPEWHMGNDGFDTPIIEDRIKETIDLADEIWCASEYLESELVNIYDVYVGILKVIPNAIDFNQPQFTPDKQKKDRYTVGYIAGANHHKDVELLYNPLFKLLGQKNYNLLVEGYSKKGESKKYWDYITTIFTSGGKLPENHFLKVEELDIYNYAYGYNHCDLMLAPLYDDLFTRCKSNLKVLEAGAFSLPIICSNVEPYKEFISQGLVYTSEGWTNRIKDLIKNPKKGQMMGKALNGYVREYYDIKKINKLRYESILSLMDSRSVLCH